MKLVILSGGKGTRLGFDNIPKPMVAIGDKPNLEHQIELAKRYNITDIYLLTGHLANVILDYFGNGEKFGVTIHHVVESRPLGTAGCVKQLEHIIHGRFLVFYGDVVMDMDLERFIDYDRRHDSIATILTHPNDHPDDSDLVEVNEKNRVIAFHSKPHDQEKYYSNNVNAAVYILSPRIFNYIPEGISTDFGKDIFPSVLSQGETIMGYASSEYVKDMGTKDRLPRVIRDFTSGKVSRLNKRNRRKAVFLDRDGVINRYVDNLKRIEDFTLFEYTSRAIRKINGSEYLSVVITNQPMVAKGFLSIDELNEIHKKMETLLGRENAYIDAVYYCPHHPDKGYEGERVEYKIDCECRKPKTGLITRATGDYNIDLDHSFFIGDTTVDIMTGRNAGLSTVLVMSGVSGNDGKYDVDPDYIFNNLEEAVDFIMNDYERYYALLNNMMATAFARNGHPLKIINIGGYSRSGKSTMASIVNKILKEKGITSKIFKLDNFILSLEKRNNSMNVLERFQINDIEEKVRELLERGKCQIKKYNVRQRTVEDRTMEFSIKENECLIIDGAVALNAPCLVENAALNIFVECDEKKRIERFNSFYNYKGLTQEEIDKLYSQRNKDEIPFLKQAKEHADSTIEA